MPAPFEILGPYSNREGDAYIVFKEDVREMHIPCTDAYERVSFYYHHISKWYRPLDQGVVSEATRAHISARITEHFVGRGWSVIIDQHHFCPHCNEMLKGSARENWTGDVCDFCGREVDVFGNLVL